MKYINTKTGAVLETACVINGGNWERVEESQPKESAKVPSKKKVSEKKSGE
jgi:hypothetical protein